MLLRRSASGVIAIGQASHAWISGQIARAWGNARFGPVEPHEEVCLAAEQHDVGMARWDLEPTYNPATQLPHAFMEMPLATHLALWSAAAPRLLSQSRYAALLVSMHGWRLYKRRELDKLPPDDADAVRGFLTEQHAFQQQLLAWLRDDPATASFASDQLVARNSQLIWTWDYLSLAICLDWAPCSVGEVPTAGGEAELRLSVIEPDGRPPGASARLLTLDPWPFSASSVEFHCDGRLLDRAFESEEELRIGLAQAPWETVSFELRSARHPQ